MRTILLVCTGNTCRSPMAESMLKDLAARAGLSLEVRSAGVGAIDGYPPSPNAAKVLAKRKLPEAGPSRSLNGESVEWADLILTMTASHKQAIVQRHPDAVGKTYTLREFAMQGDPEMEKLAEAERLYGEWQIRLATGQRLDEADHEKLMALQRDLPDFDIADPFGGTLETYERSADEIQAALRRVVDLLANSDGAGRSETPGE